MGPTATSLDQPRCLSEPSNFSPNSDSPSLIHLTLLLLPTTFILLKEDFEHERFSWLVLELFRKYLLRNDERPTSSFPHSFIHLTRVFITCLPLLPDIIKHHMGTPKSYKK